MRTTLSLAGLAALLAAPAHAQAPADPAGSSPILAALNWVQNTLLGNVATSAAVIAVAAVGFLMLT
ncbi:TrbC/VirB2 family protein, partial [Gordonia paraffinivorans]|uniref:TrbC/VirB2 family protein n=1 Tax=Gordonia paraffinivorans TaxID=175628 RepID=UPI001B356D2C